MALPNTIQHIGQNISNLDNIYNTILG